MSKLKRTIKMAITKKSMGHSPAGKEHLKRQKRKTKPTYFKGKGLARPTVEERLKKNKISYYGHKRETADATLRRLKGKK